MKLYKEKKFKYAFIAVLLIVLLSSCIFIGTVLAWLTDKDIHGSEGIIEIGAVDFDIYSGDTKITTIKNNSDGVTVVDTNSYVMELNGGSTIRNIDLTIRNTGTVSAIIRITLSIYYYDDYGYKCPCILSTTSTFDNHIAITNVGWVNDFKGNVSSGYSYYNKQIEPYTIRKAHSITGEITSQDITANAVPVITQILVPETQKDRKYYLDFVRVDGVAYSGNIYQEEADQANGGEYDVPVNAYPFGHINNIPEDWTAWK